MDVKIEELAPLKKRIAVEIPPDDVKKALNEAYAKVKASAVIEGFRKGKAPDSVIKQRFGDSVYADVAGNIVERTYPRVLKEHSIRATSKPDIEIQGLAEGSPFRYVVVVDVMPDINIEGYKDFSMERKAVDVTDEEVMKQLEALRERYAEFEKADKEAAEGDMVTVDIKCTVGGKDISRPGAKDYHFVIGQGSILPEVEDEVRGKKAGDKVGFTKTFPDGYHERAVAGKEASFKIDIKAVRVKHLAPIDNDFATALECENLEDLKAKVAAEIRKVKEADERSKERKQVMEKLIDVNKFDIPDSIVDRYYVQVMNRMLEGVRRGMVSPMYGDAMGDESKARYRELAALQAKGDMVLDIIAEKEGVQVTEGDLSEGLMKIAVARQATPASVLEKLKSDGTIELFVDGLKREKVLDSIIEGRFRK